MTWAESLRHQCDLEIDEYKFSKCLTSYLEFQAKGPDESSGYTDKRFYTMCQALLDRMDAIVNRAK